MVARNGHQDTINQNDFASRRNVLIVPISQHIVGLRDEMIEMTNAQSLRGDRNPKVNERISINPEVQNGADTINNSFIEPVWEVNSRFRTIRFLAS